jgi:hypothetical protein
MSGDAYRTIILVGFCAVTLTCMACWGAFCCVASAIQCANEVKDCRDGRRRDRLFQPEDNDVVTETKEEDSVLSEKKPFIQ